MISVDSAAKLLGLNPQTIYRKIKRGEIKCVRIGKTIRIRVEDLPEPSFPHPPIALPTSLYNLFWDVDPLKLTSQDDLVTERILDQGDLGALHWLFDNRDRSQIIHYLRSKGKRRLSKKSLNFWSAYFGQNLSSHSKLGAEDALGETRWR